MSMNYEWGPWIKHDGKGCPIVGQYAQVEFLNTITKAPSHYVIVAPNIAQGVVRRNVFNSGGGSWDWKRGNKVIRYRVRRPRVTEWLSEISTDLPERVDA